METRIGKLEREKESLLKTLTGDKFPLPGAAIVPSTEDPVPGHVTWPVTTRARPTCTTVTPVKGVKRSLLKTPTPKKLVKRRLLKTPQKSKYAVPVAGPQKTYSDGTHAPTSTRRSTFSAPPQILPLDRVQSGAQCQTVSVVQFVSMPPPTMRLDKGTQIGAPLDPDGSVKVCFNNTMYYHE